MAIKWKWTNDESTGLERRIVYAGLNYSEPHREDAGVLVKVDVEIKYPSGWKFLKPADYSIKPGLVSKDHYNNVLPKNVINSSGNLVPDLDEEGNEKPRDNEYENIILMHRNGVGIYDMVELGIPERFKVTERIE